MSSKCCTHKSGLLTSDELIFQEAAALKVVPSFNYTTGSIVIAAESMPVYAAEVSSSIELIDVPKRIEWSLVNATGW